MKKYNKLLKKIDIGAAIVNWMSIAAQSFLTYCEPQTWLIHLSIATLGCLSLCACYKSYKKILISERLELLEKKKAPSYTVADALLRLLGFTPQSLWDQFVNAHVEGAPSVTIVTVNASEVIKGPSLH